MFYGQYHTIFSRNKFDILPTYFYYRCLIFLNIIESIVSIPYGFCFTPTYISINSYACAIVQSAYISETSLNTHLVGVIEILILLDRIKILNPSLKKYLTLSPLKMCLASCWPCMLIGIVFSLDYIPVYGGEYYCINAKGSYSINSFYYVDASSLANSQIGKIVFVVIL